MKRLFDLFLRWYLDSLSRARQKSGVSPVRGRKPWVGAALGITAALAGCSGSAVAQQPAGAEALGVEFGLLKGAGTPVCEAYMARIANRPIDPRLPAERIGPDEMGVPDFGPVLGGFVSESPLLQNVVDFLWERDVNPAMNTGVEPEAWRGTLEQLAAARVGFAVRMQADMDYFGY